MAVLRSYILAADGPNSTQVSDAQPILTFSDTLDCDGLPIIESASVAAGNATLDKQQNATLVIRVLTGVEHLTHLGLVSNRSVDRSTSYTFPRYQIGTEPIIQREYLLDARRSIIDQSGMREFVLKWHPKHCVYNERIKPNTFLSCVWGAVLSHRLGLSGLDLAEGLLAIAQLTGPSATYVERAGLFILSRWRNSDKRKPANTHLKALNLHLKNLAELLVSFCRERGGVGAPIAGNSSLSDSCEKYILTHDHVLWGFLKTGVTPGSNESSQSQWGDIATKSSPYCTTPMPSVRIRSFPKGVDQGQVTLEGSHDAKFGHIFRGGSNRLYTYVKVASCGSRSHLKILNQLFPPPSEVDNRHMTVHLSDWVWHYLHSNAGGDKNTETYGVTDDSKESISQRLATLNALLQYIPIGTNQVLVLALLITAVGIDHIQLHTTSLLASRILHTNVIGQRHNLSLISVLARRCAISLQGARLTNDEVPRLAYFEMAFGRSAFTTDWAEEISNRCSRTITPHAPEPLALSKGCVDWKRDDELVSSSRRSHDSRFIELITPAIERIVRQLLPTNGTTETLDSFILRRHEWMAGGSSAGHKVVLPSGLTTKSNNLVRGHKRSWGEAITVADVRAALYKGKPKEVAHASEKYENGKARAIYGVEPMHYVINTYATKGLEERLNMVPGFEKGASGLHAVGLEARRVAITRDSSQECCMLDYADFNRHHTPRVQALLFEVLARVGRERGACHDWVKANMWVAKAKRNMAAIFQAGGKELPVRQGMFSGTRSTDLINTILNLAYMDVAKTFIQEEYGLSPVNLYNVHQGDDVWLSSSSKVWNRLLFYVLNNMGFIFNLKKQMFGPGRGEYLRVLYENGAARGYLARATVNFILRPLQNDIPLSPEAWANTLRESICTLARRGLDSYGVAVLWRDCVNYWCQYRSHANDMSPVAIPRRYMYTQTALNGLGICQPGAVFLATDALPPYPTLKSDAKVRYEGLPTHMTDDWIKHISKKAPEATRQFDVKLVREAVIQDNYRDILEAPGGSAARGRLKKQVARYKAELGSWEKKRLSKRGSIDHKSAIHRVEDLAKLIPHHCGDILPSDRYHVFDQNLNNANYTEPGHARVTSIISIKEHIDKMLAASRFKNDRLVSRAYSTDRVGALHIIMNLEADQSKLNDDMRQTLSGLMGRSDNTLLTALLDSTTTALGSLDCLCSPNVTAYLSSSVVQMVVKAFSATGIQSALQLDYHICRLLVASANAINYSDLPSTIVLY